MPESGLTKTFKFLNVLFQMLALSASSLSILPIPPSNTRALSRVVSSLIWSQVFNKSKSKNPPPSSSAHCTNRWSPDSPVVKKMPSWILGSLWTRRPRYKRMKLLLLCPDRIKALLRSLRVESPVRPATGLVCPSKPLKKTFRPGTTNASELE